jgi:antitoxin MazE
MPEEVELVVEGQQIIVSPARREPRKGWREAAERMAAAGDDELLVPDVFNDDIDIEWE